jgi:hypothetical protein
VVEIRFGDAGRPRGASWLTILVASGTLIACSGSPTDLEGSCAAVVNVDGTFLTAAGAVVPADSVEGTYLEVTRHTGCLDQGQSTDPLDSGESNFLPVGTELHRVVGFEPTDRLTYRGDSGEWRLLSTIAPGDSTELTLSVGDDVAVPGTWIRLALVSVVSDSRCPEDAVCVWAGDVEAEIGIAVGTGPTTLFRIHLNPVSDSDTVTFGGYAIRLVGVTPSARTDRVIAPEDYRLRFRIAAVDAGA